MIKAFLKVGAVLLGAVASSLAVGIVDGNRCKRAGYSDQNAGEHAAGAAMVAFSAISAAIACKDAMIAGQWMGNATAKQRALPNPVDEFEFEEDDEEPSELEFETNEE